ALNQKMNALNPSVHKLAIKLINDGPRLAGQTDIAKIPKGQQAVIGKLKKEDIVAVWGPPGTGKTYTMATIALNFVKRRKSVLIVSHSNVSVDGVIKQVFNLLDPAQRCISFKDQNLMF
ncbi:MAG: PhoH family protein, partial [Lachnospiraceae bacterium]|nr:PhoH family protein [Lachnospiraceae bacterium]